MNGSEFLVSAIILIVIILLGISFLFLYTNGYLTLGVTTNVENAKNDACYELVRNKCDRLVASILVRSFDTNNDKILNPGNAWNWATGKGSDNLAALCYNYYNANSEELCKKVCNCEAGVPGPGPGPEPPSDCPDDVCEDGEYCPADAPSCNETAVCHLRTCINGCNNPPDHIPNGQQDAEGLNRCDNNNGCGSPPCQCDGAGNCINRLASLKADARVDKVPNPTLKKVTITIDDIVYLDGSTYSQAAPGHTIVRYTWNSGDGRGWWSLTGKEVLGYPSRGVYIVTLTITDDKGDTDSDIVKVNVTGTNLPPEADARVANHSSPTGKYAEVRGSCDIAYFDATYSYDPDGTIVKYEWDFDDIGDGVYDSLDGITTHVYAVKGVYTARLRVTDADGATDEDTVTVNATSSSKPPIADARVGDALNPTGKYVIIISGNTVYFDGSTYSSDPDFNIVKWEWDFNDIGDGVYDWSSNVDGKTTYVYDTEGTYKAKLRVTDSDGCNNVSTVKVFVKPFEIAGCTKHVPLMDVEFVLDKSNTMNYPLDDEVKQVFEDNVVKGLLDKLVLSDNWTFGITEFVNPTIFDGYDFGYIKIGLTPLSNEANRNLIKGSLGWAGGWTNMSDGVYKGMSELINSPRFGKIIDGKAVKSYLVIVGDGWPNRGFNPTCSYMYGIESAQESAPFCIREVKSIVDEARVRGIKVISGGMGLDVWTIPFMQSLATDPSSTYTNAMTEGDLMFLFSKFIDVVCNETPIADARVGNAPNPTNKTAIARSGGAGRDVYFDGSTFSKPSKLGTNIVKWEWDFNGDGGYDWSSNVDGIKTYKYSANGEYVARLRVTDSDGENDTDTVIVTVGKISPIADARVDIDPESGSIITQTGKEVIVHPGETVYFDGSTYSYDPDGAIANWAWDFRNDGTYDWSSNVNGITTYVYNEDDITMSYQVFLQVTDNEGLSSYGSVIVWVDPLPTLTASITSPTDGYTFNFGDSINFDSTAVDGTPPYTYSWTSNGANIGNSQSFTKNDLSVGDHKINLTVTDSVGKTSTDQITIHIINVGILPTSFDWSHKVLTTAQPATGDWLTIPKKQECGDCWAFASIAPVEAKWNIQNSNPNLDINLSEQYLVNCLSEASGSCNGGWLAFPYIKSNGVPNSDCYPYLGCKDWEPFSSTCLEEYTCPASCVDNGDAFSTRSWKISNYDWATNVTPYIKQNLINKGPLFAAMAMRDWLASGSSGFCTYNYASDHAVVIVGYDDSDNTWIIRNSWGKDFGPYNNGYFKVKYGNCNIEQDVYYLENVIPP